MVLSKINATVKYEDTKAIASTDIEHETCIYSAKIYNKAIQFVLGLPQFEYSSKNIVYFNIYLANNGFVVSKIGIYETYNSDYGSLLDDDGDIDLSKLQEPLLFPFAKSLISKLQTTSVKTTSQDEGDEEDEDYEEGDEDDEEDDEDDDDEEDEDIVKDKKVTILPKKPNFDIMELASQTKEESDYEISKYVEDPTHNWVNKYLKSVKYSIKPNEGGGDCFFAALRDGLRTVKIETSVKAIREKLANEVDEAVFNNYSEFFKLFYGGMKKSQIMLKEYKSKHNTIKKLIGGTIDGQTKKTLIDDAKANFSKYSAINQETEEYQELVEEFEFMKDINDVKDLKKVISTVGGKYWADNWAVVTLERLYNVKFITLSQTHFLENETELVLQCSEADKQLIEKGLFEPSYYIMLDFLISKHSNHYQLITYDKNIERGAFTFNELPYKIKELILEKCMEKMAGLYVLIPDFIKFANKNGIATTSTKNDSLIGTSPNTKYYNTSIIIQIYNKSRHVKVGQGSGESISPELKTAKNILELNNNKEYVDWRRKLDSEYLVPNLVIDGKNWSSVKHYILAARFKPVIELYNKFTKDGEVGANIDDAYKLYGSNISKKSISSLVMGDEEFAKLKPGLLEKAQYSKFTQNEALAKILLLTGDALINIFKPGKGGGSYPDFELMKLRRMLSNPKEAKTVKPKELK
jgi:predicted NAD-dependent protein-ADP-ribosyltransferase YbiA (DUF1768 family)